MVEQQKLKVLVVCDLSSRPPRDQDYSSDLKSEEWESEADVIRSLQKSGHEVELFGVYNDIGELSHKIDHAKPDLIFNLSEAFSGDRSFEPNLPAFFELSKTPYTGAKPLALHLCKDKALSKKLVASEGVRTPRFETFHLSQPIQRLREFVFPALVKPLGLEASAGISQDSLVYESKACSERIKFLQERFKTDVIVEEYIEGRELYVGVFASETLEVFPARELFFEAVPEGDPKFATFKAKWDDNYRKRWGIKSGPARGLSKQLVENLAETSRKVCRALKITGYARIDFRLAAQDEIVFLEANPNPSIAAKDDFAQSARAAGIDYDELLAKIIAAVD
ncbi:MAG: hypothetical protein AB1540_11575 [Bdellovibrionota bacterium]